MNHQKIQLLIIDGHPISAEGVKAILRNHNEISILGCANTGAIAMSFLQALYVDMILLDINLPDICGIDLCRHIRKEYSNTAILVVTTFDDRTTIMKVLQNGAMGYLFKSTQLDELITAIKTVNKRRVYLGEDVQKAMNDYSPADPEEIPVLTRREREILKYMGEGLASSEIAARLLISQRTIETHKRNLMQKFNVKNSIGLIKKATGFKLT